MRYFAILMAVGAIWASTAQAGFTFVSDPNDPNETSCSHLDLFNSGIVALSDPNSWSASGSYGSYDYISTPGPEAVRIDDDNDKTWSDGRYTILARGGCSSLSEVSLGYIDPSDPNTRTFIPLCSGSKTDLQCEVNFPGDGFEWAIKVGSTVLASGDATDVMVTYDVYDPNSNEPTDGPNRHWMIFWETGADGDFNDAVFEIYKIAPMLRSGDDATMVGITYLKGGRYIRIHDDEEERGGYYASHYDTILLSSVIPWENEVIRFYSQDPNKCCDSNNCDPYIDWVWNKNCVNDPTLYDAILNAPSTPQLMDQAGIRFVRIKSKTLERQPLELNVWTDPGMTAWFGENSLYGYVPNDPNDPNGGYDPNYPISPLLDTSRNTWLLTHDGSTPSILVADDSNLLHPESLADRYELDWGVPECRDWIVNRAVERITVNGPGGHQFAGYGGDNVAIGAYMAHHNSSSSHPNWLYKGVEYEWERSGITLLKDVRDALHSKGRYFTINCDLHYYNSPTHVVDTDPNDSINIAGDAWAWDQVLYGDNGRPIVDVVQSELPLKAKGGARASSHLLGSDWERAMARHEEVLNAGVVDWWCIYPVFMDASWRSRSFLYNYASFLLIAQPGKSLFYSTLYASNVSFQLVIPWFDEYDFDLGEAHGSRVTDSSQGFCYRFYDNAVVIVNPTTNTVSVDLTDPNTLVDYRPVNLASGRGLILPRYDATKVGTDPNDPNNQKYWSGPGAIQSAIDDASDGDTLWISPGVYQESLNISGKNIVLRSLSPEDPNIVASTIVYPLDLDDPNDPNYYAPAMTFNGTEHAYDMKTREGCRIQGLFLITTDPNHAAVEGNGASASIENCIVQNDAGDGISNADGLIAYCTVSNNYGNGIVSCDGSILYSTINNNLYNGIRSGSDAGFVHNCYIQNNGRGIIDHDGVITNCLITGNHADTVGAGMMDCDGTIASCTIYSNDADDNNSDSYPSAGLYNNAAKIVHCIIYNNFVNSMAGDLNANNSVPTYSCFDIDSVDPNYVGLYEDVSTNNIFDDPELNMYYRLSSDSSPCYDAGSLDPNDIYGIEAYQYLYDTLDGNYDTYYPRGTDPVFSERGRLASRMVDLDNNPRIWDPNGDGVYVDIDSEHHTEMTVHIDLGAFEYSGDTYNGDSDSDGIPDYAELDLNGNDIPDEEELDPNTDCNGNGILDQYDLDLDNNGLVDSCEIDADPNLDYNNNGIIDAYETVLYVNGAIIGGHGDGSSWVHAFADLQEALAYAATHTFVKEIWVAAGTYTADLNSSFEPPTNVKLYGGFDGHELFFNDRSTDPNITILSGLDSNDPVVIVSDSDDVLIDGFTIRDGDYSGYGAGIRVENDSHDITISNCLITNNTAEHHAGGAYVVGASDGILFEDCIFMTNAATSGTYTTYGGAFSIAAYSSAEFSRCIFIDNAADAGGVMRISPNSTVTCSDSLLSWNSANWAAAIQTAGTLELKNCTIARNSAISSYRTIWVLEGSLDVLNSIIYGNTSGGYTAIRKETEASVMVTYSDIEDGWTGTGNIDSDPRFIDPNGTTGTSNDDFMLSFPLSPCIDAGDPNSVSDGTDLYGLSRIANGDPNTAEAIDMGAYEYQP